MDLIELQLVAGGINKIRAVLQVNRQFIEWEGKEHYEMAVVQ